MKGVDYSPQKLLLYPHLRKCGDLSAFGFLLIDMILVSTMLSAMYCFCSCGQNILVQNQNELTTLKYFLLVIHFQHHLYQLYETKGITLFSDPNFTSFYL